MHRRGDVWTGVTGRILAVFRPEAVEHLREDREPPRTTAGVGGVVNRESLGAIWRHRLRLADGSLIHLDEHKPDPGGWRQEGERVRFVVRPADAMLFPAET